MLVVSSNNPTPFDNLMGLPTYQAGVAQSTAQRLLRKFTEDSLSEHGITMMQWFIIGTIYDAGELGIGVTELSKAVDTNVPYITNTLNLLEHKNIVERKTRANNNRAKVVKIAPHYITTVEKIEADLRVKMRTAIYANITPKELRTYLTVLYKLVRSLGANIDGDDLVA